MIELYSSICYLYRLECQSNCQQDIVECLENENVSIVTKKEVQTLSSINAFELLEAMIKTVNECVAEVPRFGFEICCWNFRGIQLTKYSLPICNLCSACHQAKELKTKCYYPLIY